jgi:hypothetical protein
MKYLLHDSVFKMWIKKILKYLFGNKASYELEYYVDKVRQDDILVNDNSYMLNMTQLTCECMDWVTTRINYQLNQPGRLCKHLIRNMSDDINMELLPYQHCIKHFKMQCTGFSHYDEIIYIPNTDIIVFLCKKWILA